MKQKPAGRPSSSEKIVCDIKRSIPPTRGWVFTRNSQDRSTARGDRFLQQCGLSRSGAVAIMLYEVRRHRSYHQTPMTVACQTMTW